MRYEFARALSPLLPPLGAHRIRELLYPRRQAYSDNRPFLVHAVTGSPFCGTTRDLHEYEFSVHGYFDWRNVALARAVCPQGGTIVEVGANVGTETIAFLDIVGESGTVHAFEPDPTLVSRLEHNLRLALVGALRVHPVALSAYEGTSFFETTSHSTASGAGHLTSHVEKRGLEVAVRRLDDELPTGTRVDAMFIDVEGFEVGVLRGAERTLREQRPFVLVEAFEAHQRRGGASIQELAETLDGAGYLRFRVGRVGLTTPDVDAKDPVNWACIPRERPELRGTLDRALRRAAFLPPALAASPLRARA